MSKMAVEIDMCSLKRRHVPKNDRFNWTKGSAFSGCLITAPEVHFTLKYHVFVPANYPETASKTDVTRELATRAGAR